ncbi:hypothetical protein ACH4U6_35165 [Streptomyces netropsis]|uniref:hypothetical protein n=1 Tax=Streptomyces netropsis TaxID=55404 RepID=UPI0037AA1449
MDATSIDAITEMDLARAALKQNARMVIKAVSAVLGQLYPEGAYVSLICREIDRPDSARIGAVYDAQQRSHIGPARKGHAIYPPSRIGDWPLRRLPKRITRQHFGSHADSDRTMNDLLTEAYRAGAHFPHGLRGGHSYGPRIDIR